MSCRLVLAVGLFVAAAVVFSRLPVPHLSAQQKAAPPAVPPTYPTLTSSFNLGAKPGGSPEFALTGTNLAGPTGVWTSLSAKAATSDAAKDKLKVKLTLPADAPIGVHFLRVATKTGVSNLRPFCVDELPEVAETDKNRSKSSSQTVPVPCVVTGRADPEAADYFKFPATAGQPITVEVLGRRLGSPMDPVVILYDDTGRELGGVYADDTPGLQADARVVVTPKQSGDLIAEVRDTTYRGGADYTYRVRIGAFPGATTAFPLVVQRGETAEVGFSGPGLDGVEPVTVTAPTDPRVPAVYVAPKRADGPTGWPVPVRLSDDPQTLEKEPNNDPAKANKLPVPGGVSAKFGEKNDVDHFAFPAKKGQKYTVAAAAYELNAPTEVYLRVLDLAGKELAKSNPQQPTARAEVTASADGELIVACEHLNYLAGPSEVYHLSVTPAAPDFAVTVALGRIDVPMWGEGKIPVTGLTKLNGFNAPVELTVVGGGLTGSLTVPEKGNPQPTAPLFVPVRAGVFARPGVRVVVLKATAKVGGKEIVRYATVNDAVKAALGNLPNPPPELTNKIAVAVGTPRKEEPKKKDEKKKK
jgi:hypothetical protein